MLAHQSHFLIFSCVVNGLITSTVMQFTIHNSLYMTRHKPFKTNTFEVLPIQCPQVTTVLFNPFNYALISGHPGGLTPGTYVGIARYLLTFVADFWLGTGALDRFCTSEARYKGKDPRDL